MKLFGISYTTWKSVCDMYFSLNEGSKKAYLQWFPFTKLSKKDEETISGEDFYNTYIKTASLVLFSSVMHQSENFLQKGDGSFRDSSLIGPILYLTLQSIGMEIHNRYNPMRPQGVSAYYAGNYNHLRPKYKQDYDDFYKELNASIGEYQYFIKTDITSFYSNININKLIDRIDKNCNANSVVFSQTQLQLYKELLLYCGNGRFPLIENSIASSYLATIVYLDEIDTALYKYITTNMHCFLSFRIVRYVDDMYILISSDKSIEFLYESYNEIRNEYSSILKSYGLALNSKKCCLKKTTEINQELKKSLYDEFFNGKKHNIEDLFAGALYRFLQDLSIELLFDSVDVEEYNKLINKHFSSPDIEFTPSEVFNYFVYENDNELNSEKVVDEIVCLIEQSISFISLDPKRLTVMIMKTKSEKAIKAFLSQLFEKNRSGKWNSYDTTIAISYLIQRQFEHEDLLMILSRSCPSLYEYYILYCKASAIACFDSTKTNRLCKIIAQDYKAHYLYFLYFCEIKRANYMAAFAYYKNYFDRVTADMDFVFSNNRQLKRPNYKGFYKEKAISDFYKNVTGSEVVIKKAHELRNSNPLSHASSGLLDSDNTSTELLESIKDLSALIDGYIEKWYEAQEGESRPL